MKGSLYNYYVKRQGGFFSLGPKFDSPVSSVGLSPSSKHTTDMSLGKSSTIFFFFFFFSVLVYTMGKIIVLAFLHCNDSVESALD